MTTSPPSETEAIALEIITEIAGRDIAESHSHCANTATCSVTVIAERLRTIQRAAKRSAHLEDARAGCLQCRESGAPEPYFVAGERRGWFHERRGCERPEVWDALSLLPRSEK